MVNRKQPAPISQGRASMSLGASDPSLRRNAEAALQTGQNLGRSITRDSRGRTIVKEAPLVKDLVPEGATLEDAVAKINEILRSQRDSGQMKGGR